MIWWVERGRDCWFGLKYECLCNSLYFLINVCNVCKSWAYVFRIAGKHLLIETGGSNDYELDEKTAQMG